MTERTQTTCAHCGRGLEPIGPPAFAAWCGDDCMEAWYAHRPDEAAKWTPVEALSLEQVAELEAMLGHGAKC